MEFAWTNDFFVLLFNESWWRKGYLILINHVFTHFLRLHMKCQTTTTTPTQHDTTTKNGCRLLFCNQIALYKLAYFVPTRNQSRFQYFSHLLCRRAFSFQTIRNQQLQCVITYYRFCCCYFMRSLLTAISMNMNWMSEQTKHHVKRSSSTSFSHCALSRISVHSTFQISFI